MFEIRLTGQTWNLTVDGQQIVDLPLRILDL